MRHLAIAIALLVVLTGCGSDDPQTLAEGVQTDTGAATTAGGPGVSADQEFVASLEGRWLPGSVSRFCPVGMAIGPGGATTEAPPPDDILDLTTIDEVTFNAREVRFASSCGEISTFAGTFSRCVGRWRVVDAMPSDDGWAGTLQVEDLACEPKERALPSLAVSVSSDSLELEDIAFRR